MKSIALRAKLAGLTKVKRRLSDKRKRYFYLIKTNQAVYNSKEPINVTLYINERLSYKERRVDA